MTTQSTTQFLKIKDGSIAYDVQGSGPLIILMPAGGDIRSSYRFVIPQLVAAGNTVVTMDLRGQGESSVGWSSYKTIDMAEDIKILIEHLAMAPAVLVGNSVAAGMATIVANKSPRLVSGVVMIGPFTRTQSQLKSWLVAQLSLSSLWGNGLYHGYFAMMHPGVREPDFEEHRAKVDAMLKEKGRLRALRAMFSDGGTELDANLAVLKQPVTIIMGSKDPDFPKPEEEVKEIVERLKSTTPTVEMIDGAGHHPQAQSPDRVAQLILDLVGESKP